MVSVSTSGSTSTAFGYAGEYTDAETSFLYLRARYYDPASQPFLTVDPLLAATEQAYNYAGGSPLNGTDPSGMDQKVCRPPGCGGTPVDLPFGATGGMPTLPNPVPAIKTLIAVTAGLAAYIGTQMLGLTPQHVPQQTCYASSTKLSTTMAVKGEYEPRGLSKDQRNKYRQAIHKYKFDNRVPAGYPVPHNIIDDIADAIKGGSSPNEAADNAPPLPGVDYDPENPPDWVGGR